MRHLKTLSGIGDWQYTLIEEDAEKQCVKSDRFDRSTFAQVIEESDYLKELLGGMKERYLQFPQLLRDLYTSYFRYAVFFRDYKEIDKNYHLNILIITEITATKQYQRMRRQTVLDEHMAMLAAVLTAETVMKSLAERNLNEKNDLAKAEEQLRQQELEMLLFDELFNEMEESERSDQLTEMKKRMKEEIDDKRDEIRELEDIETEIESPGDGETDNLMERISKSFDKTRDDISNWGNIPGKGCKMNSSQRLELALKAQNSEKVRELFNRIGRFKMAAISAGADRMRHGVDEIYEIECGNEISRVIPAELSSLINPLLKKDFFRRYHERRLLTYHLKRNDPGEKGPLIIALDLSYSMEGNKELWAKAVALSLRELAWRKKRHFALIGFGAKDDPLLVIKFAPFQERMEDIVRIAEFFLGGGTDFHRPLDSAVSILNKREFKEGDIVLITDGDCPMEKAWVKNYLMEKNRLGFNHYTVLTDSGYCTREHVRAFSDEIILVSDLDIEGARSVFSSLPF